MQGSQKREELRIHVPSEERLALRWATLLCGQESMAGLSPPAAKNQLLAWAAAHLESRSALLSSRLQPLPEPFLTTRFLNATKSLDADLERIRAIVRDLSRGETDYTGAMTRLMQNFQGDEARLIQWRDRAADLPRFKNWLAKFQVSHAYLCDALPTAVERLEEIKKQLVQLCAEPHRFLDACERERFDRGFAEFKTGYIDCYYAAHEDTVHILGNQERMESKVDAMALRNLELLSELDHADKGYLNRVRALGKWVHAHQCELPVREILLRHPRCYCNYNPTGSRHLAESVDQMNEGIRQGIDHFRSILRRSRMILIQELKAMKADDHLSKQIAALLSRGPMIPLKQQSVDILNAVIKKHPEAFLTADNRLQTSNSRSPDDW
jgi:hypothetical protein